MQNALAPRRRFLRIMLTLSGKPQGKLCDGLARRDFLRIGGLAMGGLSLAWPEGFTPFDGTPVRFSVKPPAILPVAASCGVTAPMNRRPPALAASLRR